MCPQSARLTKQAARGSKATATPFAAVPHGLLADSRLTHAERLVGANLLFWAQNKAICWPTNGSIAERADIKPRSVPRALERLEAFGYVRRLPDPSKPAGRVIVLLWHPESKQTIERYGSGAPPLTAGSSPP